MNTLHQKPPHFLFWRSLFFTVLQPGMVAGIIPWWIAGHHTSTIQLSSFNAVQLAGLLLLLAGIVVTVHCIIRFAVDGRGTLSPVDPTKKLVIAGLYKYSRNPMYIGVMLMLTGECMIAPVSGLIIYTTAIFTGFNLFIVFYEEPRLLKDFGDSYAQYCKKVRRWL
ncbi:isoprenylcysteine carboxylmethyltransferase family protein [Pseudoflavitalea sp. G-6-1-2]|uniref:methyltransferase family protein n=1 Tax=Pseudoflavitalea sp. G-6-1-2 TaxID=2728841 RepID=UPI00146DF31A|nr:isoprenylcysteine carboxylmethyltransferase family protein [Pseudoflavitalea sp. G-6-1-2]NML22045.1 isoprenylcysteine carboxylmethyltransferase family protein [Pseudoflavitalea sp. G-6-1-2]